MIEADDDKKKRLPDAAAVIRVVESVGSSSGGTVIVWNRLASVDNMNTIVVHCHSSIVTAQLHPKNHCFNCRFQTTKSVVFRAICSNGECV